MTVLGEGVAFVMNQKVDWRMSPANVLHGKLRRAANLSAEQNETEIREPPKIHGIAYGFGIAWPILQALIVGGVLLLTYNDWRSERQLWRLSRH